MTRAPRRLLCSGLLLILACGPKAPAETETPGGDAAAPATTDATANALALAANEGGLLFDNWAASPSFEGEFKADDKGTPDADGSGGPNGNGTLNGADGQPVLNAGHDYRLKNFFGWDLRGAEGIYGADYQNKATALPVNLLTDTRSSEELASWFLAGGEGLPAYSGVLDEAQAAAIADFVVSVRDKSLPHPDQIWTLSKDAPKNYTLNEGADPEAGKKFIADSCGCHGDDGTSMAIDEDYTLGSFARAKAYEAWIKIVNGQPGTAMGRQTDDAATVLNVLAAFCDRTAFPPKDAEHDVKDGDARCGAYLK